MESAKVARTSPESYRFQIHSFREQKPALPMVIVGGVAAELTEMLWEEPPGFELTASMAERYAAAEATAETFADRSGCKVMLGMVPLIGPRAFDPTTIISPKPLHHEPTGPDYDPSDERFWPNEVAR